MGADSSCTDYGTWAAIVRAVPAFQLNHYATLICTTTHNMIDYNHDIRVKRYFAPDLIPLCR